MTVLERLETWRNEGAITATQYSTIAPIVRKDRFSLFVELNVLLYLGVLCCIAGLGWTVSTYFQNLGDALILTALTSIFAASLYYCFSRTIPYSSERVESPNLLFDYILYLGVLVFATELAYIEFRFQVLQARWDYYLLFSAILYFFFAYRFDNRFVLSLALSTLAGWFGLSFSRYGFLRSGNYRWPAIIYALVVVLAGTALWRAGLKQHFLRTYLHVAANVLFAALVSGVAESHDWPFLPALLVLSAFAIYVGFRLRAFSFAGYGTVYGYIGVSIWALRGMRDTPALTYLVISGIAVIGFIAWLAVNSAREQ